MTKDDVYYEAIKARDPRFDGKFFFGVKTTGIYCRPICPAKPKRKNIVFFGSTQEAQAADYRPCKRCRPDTVPQSPAWIGKAAVVRRALKILSGNEALSFDEERFAARFGITARHLRRLFVDEMGKTPRQIASEGRLREARRLLVETKMPVAEVAFASGFRSVRRFNDAFRDCFKTQPRRIRSLNAEKGKSK